MTLMNGGVGVSGRWGGGGVAFVGRAMMNVARAHLGQILDHVQSSGSCIPAR